MADVWFTQYLRPNGEKKQVWIDRPQEVADRANRIIMAGYWLEAEVLTTGNVSFTVSDADDDHMFEVVPNGPGVPEAIDRLVTRFVEEKLS